MKKWKIKIYWKDLLKKIENAENIEGKEAIFDSEKVLWKDALILGKKGIEVPEELIEYGDENIDYTDIPPITDEDIASGKIKWIHKAEVPIRKEIED